jgi:hypothetical protein
MELGREGMDWIDLAYDGDTWQAFVKTAMNLLVQQYVGNFLTSLETISFSRRGLLRGVNRV